MDDTRRPKLPMNHIISSVTAPGPVTVLPTESLRVDVTGSAITVDHEVRGPQGSEGVYVSKDAHGLSVILDEQNASQQSIHITAVESPAGNVGGFVLRTGPGNRYDSDFVDAYGHAARWHGYKSKIQLPVSPDRTLQDAGLLRDALKVGLDELKGDGGALRKGRPLQTLIRPLKPM
jgi:hypothetical protein